MLGRRQRRKTSTIRYALNARGDNLAAESLFMVLILQQQRMINQLIQKLSVYKIELWKLIKDVLRLLTCDTQKLEEQIFPAIIEDGTTVSGAIYTSRANRRNSIDNDYRKANNIQRNESLDKYQSMMWLMPYSFRHR